jgi:hypothetical protein
MHTEIATSIKYLTKTYLSKIVTQTFKFLYHIILAHIALLMISRLQDDCLLRYEPYSLVEID